ncbi:hypothetical protein ACFFX1_18260 [Dactylosporangium sucinum]|uniref:Uncharacterized protein n=1 Tax=Dactylosporangium sucinum TaxID=1424081 RepID=A0A917TX88_9ACTN|nr:hypothetical protein [Dactylosporangium sucinum]GGM41097.1 hypothetical protein GCM10007977_048150 [Dactylosporangium sucinum]
MRTKPPARTRPRPQQQQQQQQRWWVAVAPLVTLIAGGLLGAWIGAAFADPRTDTEKRIDAMEAAEVQRDAEQVVTLTDQARRIRDLLTPVLDGLHTAVPPKAAQPGEAPAQSKADGWKVVTRKAVSDFADPPSAGTAVNIARSSLAAGARQLDLAVDTYAAAVKAPEAERPALLALAGRQRDTAIATWSVGATQLDQLNVDTGHGHQHVFLPSQPGQGAMTADGEQEGK